MARFHGPKFITNGLVIYYDAANMRSYSGNGTFLDDISGNGKYATLYNGVAHSTANGGCFIFDGTDDYVFTESDSMPVDAYTKIVWFYITDFTNVNNLLSGDNTSRHALWLDSSTNLKSGHNGGAEFRSVVSTTTLVANTWYFGAATWENGIEHNLYVNGNLESSNTVATNPYAGDSRLVHLGSYGETNFLEGRIALAAIYDRALTADEIRQNFNAHRGRFGI